MARKRSPRGDTATQRNDILVQVRVPRYVSDELAKKASGDSRTVAGYVRHVLMLHLGFLSTKED